MKILRIKEFVSRYKQKLILYTIGALLLTGSAFIVSGGIKRYMEIKQQLEYANNSVQAYMDQFDASMKSRAVLELSAATLRRSNDSLIQSLEETRKSLKIALNKPGDVAANIVTKINTTDTIYLPLPAECRFDTVIKPNDLTKFSIKYENNSLIHSAEINNEQHLFVYSQREYINEYKNGFRRFLRFDWRKRDISRYEIENTNDKIKVTDTRVIKIIE